MVKRARRRREKQERLSALGAADARWQFGPADHAPEEPDDGGAIPGGEPRIRAG